MHLLQKILVVGMVLVNHGALRRSSEVLLIFGVGALLAIWKLFTMLNLPQVSSHNNSHW